MAVEIKQKFVETKNKRGKIFYYTNEIKTNKPTIILLHGLSSNHTTWSYIAELLSKNSYNFILPDLRGHGYSDKTKNKNLYKLSIFCSDLKEIIEQEKISKPVLVGYSFGGTIAFEYANHNSEKISDLILISANHANPLHFTKWKFFIPVISFLLALSASLVIKQEKDSYQYYNPHQTNGYWNSVRLGFRTMPWSVNLWMLLMISKINPKKEILLKDLQTLIIYSKNDPFLYKNEIKHYKKILPKAKFVESKNKSHFIATESEEELSNIIIKYLEKYENSNIQ